MSSNNEAQLQSSKPLADTDLKDDGLVVFAEVEGKDVGVHEGLTAETQNVHSLLQELHLNPGHVMLLHLLHLASDSRVQLQQHDKVKTTTEYNCNNMTRSKLPLSTTATT